MSVIRIEVDKFMKEIEELVKRHDTSYMDAIVHYSQKNNIEIETVADIVKKLPVVKVNLLEEAEDLNMIEKSSKLPT